MGFSNEDIERFRKLVAEAQRPLILFDDDCDGTAACVMLYHAIGEGRVIPVKKTPQVTELFARKVEEYGPDVVFILDKPQVSDDFFDRIKTPIVWLDHHEPQKVPSHCSYFNPRVADDADNLPTSYWIWKMVGKPADMWLAAVGTIGDWHIPDFIEEVKDQYPGLLPEKWKKFGDLYVDTKVGELILLFNFIMKGTTTETLNAIKTLLKIESPFEILDQSSSRGKYLWKRFDRSARHYYSLMERAREVVTDKQYLVFIYSDASMTFTRELSNELLIRYPGKIIIVGRRHQGSVKASFRSDGLPIVDAIKSALEGVDGHGGGHTHACGAGINEQDWEKFLATFKSEMELNSK